MGVRTIHDRFDDLTGQTGPDIEKFTFILDGVEYSMDACTATREGVRQSLAKYTAVAKARVLGPGASSTEIREWAKEEGFVVHDNGRLPDKVIQAYHDAHP